MRIMLFQPRYPHGGKRQIYLPGGLLNLGSRLINAGVEVTFGDLNLTDLDNLKVAHGLANADRIGISVLGTPYIPVARRMCIDLRNSGFSQPILIGGEGVARITPEHFARIYGDVPGIRQVATDAALSMNVGMRPIPSAYETSMTPMLERLPERQLIPYLDRELCLFLSQGCAFSCRFCAADKGRREQYRSIDSLHDEVLTMCAALKHAGRNRLTVYLSNLDVMQTPNELEERLAVVAACAAEHALTFTCRGLATTRCTVNAVRRDPHILRRLQKIGLRCLGFGVDGADVRVWQRENKKHNSLAEISASIRAMQAAGIDSEILMIAGFPDDDAKAMWAALQYSVMSLGPGVYLRPYLAKKGVPGSEPWTEEVALRDPYLADPERFVHLDYAMFGSATTHPDRRQRWLANATYAAMITLSTLRGRCHTPPLLPEVGGVIRRRIARLFNRLMPFDP